MTKADVIEHYQGVTPAAKALGFTKGAISQWPDQLPAKLQCFIEIVSKGELKADRNVLPKSA